MVIYDDDLTNLNLDQSQDILNPTPLYYTGHQ